MLLETTRFATGVGHEAVDAVRVHAAGLALCRDG
jgi:hypothetical protein